MNYRLFVFISIVSVLLVSCVSSQKVQEMVCVRDAVCECLLDYCATFDEAIFTEDDINEIAVSVARKIAYSSSADGELCAEKIYEALKNELEKEFNFRQENFSLFSDLTYDIFTGYL